MRKIAAIVFLSLYLFSTTEFHELLKIPALVEHFSEHKQKENSITIWKFLCNHYTLDNVKDKDHSKDMKLPFKAHDNCNSSSFVTLLPEQKFTIGKTPPFRITKTIDKYYIDCPTSSFLNAIWQPPQIS